MRLLSGYQQKWYVGYTWTRTSENGGSARAAGCHAVDAPRQFVAAEATEVFAYAGNLTGVMEWDPTITTLVRFANGTIGKVGCVLEGNIKYQFNLRLHDARGTLVNNRFLTEDLPGQTDWAEFPTILPRHAGGESPPAPSGDRSPGPMHSRWHAAHRRRSRRGENARNLLCRRVVRAREAPGALTARPLADEAHPVTISSFAAAAPVPRYGAWPARSAGARAGPRRIGAPDKTRQPITRPDA